MDTVRCFSRFITDPFRSGDGNQGDQRHRKGQTDPDGDAILREKGIDMLPAILCNAREFAVSCSEWLQNRRRESWDLEGVDTGPHREMVSACKRVRDAAHDHNTDLRIAAYIVALSRLGKVYEERGIFP